MRFNQIAYSWAPFALLRSQRRGELRRWRQAPNPDELPTLLKQALVREYAQRFGLKTLVETGTYLGEMVAANRRHFQRVITCELNPFLCARARRKFRRWPEVEVLEGDSATVMTQILPQLQVRCLFWLDAHYSGGITARGQSDTPIMQELELVLRHPQEHVVLIDDARCFDGSHGYPTIEAVKALASSLRPDWRFENRDGVIRIHPPQ